jgi:hypothetical protein
LGRHVSTVHRVAVIRLRARFAARRRHATTTPRSASP